MIWYIFTAYNSEALYGCGCESDAEKYCNYLNRDREINCYQYAELSNKDRIDRLNSGMDDSGFDIEPELYEIAEAE